MLDAIHWQSSVRGLLDALGMGPGRPGAAPGAVTLESIRQVMLHAVDGADTGKTALQKTRLLVRVNSAKDAQALWYLRSDLMQLLSACKGEAEARRTLDGISTLFVGLIPSGFHTRPAHRLSGYDGAMPRRPR